MMMNCLLCLVLSLFFFCLSVCYNVSAVWCLWWAPIVVTKNSHNFATFPSFSKQSDSLGSVDVCSMSTCSASPEFFEQQQKLLSVWLKPFGKIKETIDRNSQSQGVEREIGLLHRFIIKKCCNKMIAFLFFLHSFLLKTFSLSWLGLCLGKHLFPFFFFFSGAFHFFSSVSLVLAVSLQTLCSNLIVIGIRIASITRATHL